MESIQSKSRLHPLVAGAAGAVIIASAVAVAAIGGYLPGSNADTKEASSAPSPAKPEHAKPPHARAAQPKPVQVAAACTNCGVIVDIKEENVMGKGTGVGAVAGGVAGAVIGHEIGNGSRAGTAVGAVMGGVAGHQIERSARSTKRYDVSVRMEDGSVKTVLSDTPPTWHAGDKVRVQDGVLKPL